MKKEHRNDLILIICLIVGLLGAFLGIFLSRKKENLVAKIYVRNELVETVELSKSEDYEFEIEGTKGKLVVSIKDHAIAIIDADCPHKDCVHTGYVSETNKPIICAYNQVYIVIDGSSDYDVRI